MKQVSFLDNFIDVLSQKIDKRSQLVSFISEALNIERDSASRRLNQKVAFSVEEVSILSVKLGISLDSMLIGAKEHFRSPPFSVHAPMRLQSIDILATKIESDLQILDNMCNEPAEFGFIFIYPPIEFFIPYKNLLKFTYFKWGYYHTNSLDFHNYSMWKIPQNLLRLNDKIVNIYNKWEKILYIWDISAIWSFVKDVTYFHSIGFLNANETETIKNELDDMLYGMEKMIIGADSDSTQSRNIEMYVSSVHMGANFSYYISKKLFYNTFHTYFAGTNYNDDYQTTVQLRDWMNSMKKVCSLISGSGARERKLFFNEQHEIVDTINL